MPSAARAELISASEKDVDQLTLITKRLSDESKLQDTLSEFSKRQLEDFWDAVLLICMSTILDCETEEKDLKQAANVLGCITTLAGATVENLQQMRKKEEETAEDVAVPHSLQEAVIILHGVLPTLTSEMSKLKNKMSCLFEEWWTYKFPCREEVMGNTIVYLITRSTQPKSSQRDVSRVWAVHKVLSAIDLSAESSNLLMSLLLSCLHHHQFVTTAPGLRFLVHLFTLSPQLTEQFHRAVKNGLHATPKSWHSKYGEIYFRAWQKSPDENRLKIEQGCIQDLMYRAVHSQRGGQQSTASILFRVLSYIHKQKTQRGVEQMLNQLYEPILWRSLMVSNCDVRVNAASIMFDVFPLQNPGLNVQQADQTLQRQFDVMHSLLSDSVAEVRLVAVKGVGRVLSLYWELIPAQVIQGLVTTLVQELAFDVSSPVVREAVIKVMHQLCDNHLCILMLKKVLPGLRNFVHDTSEKVRAAMFDLLLKVKGLRAIKFWSIVPVEHILSRLEIDTPPIARRIMKLITASFVPVDQPPAEQIERCLTLIKGNPGAARQFFVHLPQHLPVQECAKYITLLCRYALETVRQQQQQTDDSVADRSDNSDSSRDASRLSDDKNETPSGSKRARRKSSSRAGGKEGQSGRESGTAGQSSVANADMQHSSGSDGAGNGEDQSDGAVMLRGVVEAMYLMYTGIAEKLDAGQEAGLKDGLTKKLCITVRELMASSQDPNLDTALVALAGHLPSRSLPLVSQNLVKRLKNSGSGADRQRLDSAVMVKSLVLWGQAGSVLDMVRESFCQLIEGGENRESSSNKEKKGAEIEESKKKKKAKKVVGFAVEKEATIEPKVAMTWLVEMLTQAECQPILVRRHMEDLNSVLKAMRPILEKLTALLCDDDRRVGNSAVEESLMVQVFTTYLRLLAFVGVNGHLFEGGKGRDMDAVAKAIKEDVCKSLDEVLSWTGEVLLEKLRNSSKDTLLHQCEVVGQLIAVVLKMSRCLLMVDAYNQGLFDRLVDVCTSLTALDFPCLPTDVMHGVLACLYQMSQVRNSSQRKTNMANVEGDDGSNSNNDDATGNNRNNNNKLISVVNSCLCRILDSLHTASADREEEEKEMEDEEDRSGEGEGGTKRSRTSTSTTSPPHPHPLLVESAVFAEIFQELTCSGRDVEQVEKLHAAMLRCIIRDLLVASEEDRLGGGQESSQPPTPLPPPPPLSATLLAAVKKRSSNKRTFLEEVERRLTSETERCDIHSLHAMTFLVCTFKSYGGQFVPRSLERSICQLLSQVTANGMDEDVFRDVKRLVQNMTDSWESLVD
ncbi:condensin-2 complex subunit G2 [Aplysia californica]|uniref:Condensin-2 complex subunit G2 n=1 Tax=Aplysia californica TaxID=6500 RepID=A0ABM1A325_APLCA|nr:condensin-2 complex subunit G2 [Aplysia californica]